MADTIRLAVSNIAWTKAEDETVYAAMQAAGFTGLELAPTRIFPDRPYEQLTPAMLFGGYLKNRWGFAVPSLQSIWYGQTGSIFDPELLYERFPNEIVPYDYDTYFSNPATFEMVTTNCLTGKSEYLSERSGDRKRLIDIVRASSSLPYVSKIVDVDGVPMLDGGIIDSIPVMRAVDMGFRKNVVVATRNRGFRNNGRDRKIPRFIYRNYPRLRVALSHRIEAYNAQLEMVERMEDEGSIVCIRPQRPMEVGRIEKDIKKLEALYEEGFRLGEEFCEREFA